MDLESKMILDRREKTLLGEDIKYILFARDEKTAIFFVTVEFRGICETNRLGVSLEEAMKIFNALTDGSVTPCTLADVVADLQYSHTI